MTFVRRLISLMLMVLLLGPRGRLWRPIIKTVLIIVTLTLNCCCWGRHFFVLKAVRRVRRLVLPVPLRLMKLLRRPRVWVKFLVAVRRLIMFQTRFLGNRSRALIWRAWQLISRLIMKRLVVPFRLRLRWKKIQWVLLKRLLLSQSRRLIVGLTTRRRRTRGILMSTKLLRPLVWRRRFRLTLKMVTGLVKLKKRLMVTGRPPIVRRAGVWLRFRVLLSSTVLLVLTRKAVPLFGSKRLTFWRWNIKACRPLVLVSLRPHLLGGPPPGENCGDGRCPFSTFRFIAFGRCGQLILQILSFKLGGVV